MAERFKDMTGKVFGRLHVLRRAENDRYGMECDDRGYKE